MTTPFQWLCHIFRMAHRDETTKCCLSQLRAFTRYTLFDSTFIYCLYMWSDLSLFICFDVSFTHMPHAMRLHAVSRYVSSPWTRPPALPAVSLLHWALDPPPCEYDKPQPGTPQSMRRPWPQHPTKAPEGRAAPAQRRQYWNSGRIWNSWDSFEMFWN